MKRFLLTALAILLTIGMLPTTGAFAKDAIFFFSVALVHPQTGRETPLMVYYDGRFTVDNRKHIPHGAKLHVKIKAPRGKYLSVVFRDDADTQYDLPRRARYLDSDNKEFMWTMPRRFVPGNVEIYLCLYATMNQETGSMGEYAIDRTHWITLGDTSL